MSTETEKQAAIQPAADAAQELQAAVSTITGCPVCGSGVHTETMYNRLWIVCDQYPTNCVYRKLAS